MRSFPVLAALSLLGFVAGGKAAAAGSEITLGINGGKAEKNPGKVPHDAIEVTFHVKPPVGMNRYRLVGFDQDWTRRNGDMFFLVRFHNGKGDQIGQQAFRASGQSSGWQGTIEDSSLTNRSEKVTVPPDAHHVTVAISSAGPASTIGTFAISNVHVYGKSGAGAPRDLIGEGTGTKWNKGGTRPSMASTGTGDDGAPLYVITDDDITGHADWSTSANEALQVTPGETLNVHWQELYSTGAGDAFSAKYGRLPPGSYRFEVEALGLSGEQRGDPSVLPFKVPLPYWRNPWYWAGCAVILIIGSSLLGRHLIRKKIQLHLAQAQIIADERLRIARDLHDDLGARLSHISLLGSHAIHATAEPGTQQTLRQISGMSRELITSLSETVWMLNSKNDHLESLVNYLCRMVSELCKSLDIRCRIDAVSQEEDLPVSGELRHHVSMAVKEAVNNALKHSQCTEIRLKIHRLPSGLEIVIEDNGIGLNAAGNEQGNGLANIQQRMETLGGSMRIGETEEHGVTITLRVPL